MYDLHVETGVDPTSISSSQPKSHLTTMPIAGPDAHDSLIRLRVSCFNGPEALREPRYDIARLGSDEDVRGADPRPAPKGNEFPHGPDALPTLRAELLRVLAPDVGVSVHQVPVAVDDVALLDEDGRFAVGASADG